MKGVRKRLLAVLLSCFVLIISVAGKCQVVGATSVVGPATAGGISAAQTLEFLYSVLMSMGITLNLKEMIRYHDPTDGYTWLDDPASQKQIDEVNDKIGEYYDNAVKDWYEKHGGKITPSPEPTKTPDSSPPSPVTPAPTSIPPDISEKIDSWNEMRKKAMANRVLTMTAVAGACLKEAVSNWWDDIMDNENEYHNVSNSYAYNDLIGEMTRHYYDSYAHCNVALSMKIYRNSKYNVQSLDVTTVQDYGITWHYVSVPRVDLKISHFNEEKYIYDDGREVVRTGHAPEDTRAYFGVSSSYVDFSDSYHIYIPYTL